MSELDFDFDPTLEDDEEDWQDAEEQPSHNNNGEHKEREHKHILGENELRKKIREIQQNTTITAKEKAQQIQYLMSYGTTQPKHTHTVHEDTSHVITYHDKDKAILGCKHYQRKCKLQANCCSKLYSCRFCHDEQEDHQIVRSETKNMFCMVCSTLQPSAPSCRDCKETMARYYCDICKLWDDDPKKSIYHCHDCGICRKGKGLGQDFFHCKKCNICMIISMKKHKCIERNLESDCPICGEYLFTSTSKVIFMKCGHSIHQQCYTAYIQTSYQCPTCLKSLCNMSEYFNRLDRDLERQPMPAEYEKYISHIFCNDCEKKSPAKYHFFYHKCAHCGSFNTTVLKTENTEETAATHSTAREGSSSVPSAEIGESTDNSDRDHTMPPPSGSSRSRNGAECNEG